MTALEALAIAYKLVAVELATYSGVIEAFLDERGLDPSSASMACDERRIYEELSTPAGVELLVALYEYFVRLAESEGGDDRVLSQLDILQQILAKKYWKYGYRTSTELDYFTEEFDRLDNPEERARWYRELRRNRLG